MSSIVIKGNTSGQVEIAAPDVAGSTTLTLPTGTANLLTADGDGSQLTNLPQPASLSTATGSAPSYSARVWVNFNGTGTIAVRNSGNVSSLADNGTGNYTVNFATALSASTYCVTAHTNHVTNTSNTRGFLQSKTTNRTTTSITVVCVGDGGTILDFEVIDFALFI